MSQEHRIGFIISSDYALENVITLIDGVRALAELGYKVDVLAPSDNLMPVHFHSDRIRLYSFQRPGSPKATPTEVSRLTPGWVNAKASLFNKLQHIVLGMNRVPLLLPVASLARRSHRWLHVRLHHMHRLIHAFGSLIPFWLQLTRGKQYLCFFGVEPGGLFVATIASILQGVPVVYYNMELLLSQEVQDKHKLLIKWLERECNRRAALTIIQDEARAGLLGRDNSIPLSRVAIVPCGMLGPSVVERTDYLREKYGIPATNRIVLYVTKITHWARVAELAQQAIHWPDGWVLVVHGYPKIGEYVAKVQNIISRGSGQVVMSDEMLPQSQLESLVSSANIGIALYKDLGANFRHTGSASGKLSLYLKCGLPVITNDFPSMREIVEGYGCGVCVRDESQVIEAAGRIMADYQQYRTNALNCFAGHYDLRPYWRAIMGRLEGHEPESRVNNVRA